MGSEMCIRDRRVAGYAVAAAGTALAGTGMTSFAGPQQFNGGETGDLITGGIYNYSRHPQYAGFVAATAGLAAARGSQRAALLAIALAVIMRAWVGVEERHLRRQFGAAYGPGGRQSQMILRSWRGRSASRL